MSVKWVHVLGLACWLAPLQAQATDVRQTVRAAILADENFLPSLYTEEFVTAHKDAVAKDGLAAEGGLTGEAGTGRIHVESMRVVGNHVLVNIRSDRDGAEPLIKTITFFIAPNGKIADVDTNTRGKLTVKGPMQQMPTLLSRYQGVLNANLVANSNPKPQKQPSSATIDEIDRWLIEHYQECWRREGSTKAANYVPAVRIRLSIDGDLTSATIVNPPLDTAFQNLAASAFNAVARCNPLPIPSRFKNLYAEGYRQRVLRFDTSKIAIGHADEKK